GTAVYLYNNFISDLKAPSASNYEAIRGISLTSTVTNSTIGVYFNSIYLNASSIGANFGTCGLYHTASATATTASLDLRNNIIVNESTPNGSGSTAAFRRSAGTLGNYAASSNNNIFYAGVPGANNSILYTGTSYQTIEAYKTFVGPSRDSLSFSELPPFVNSTTPPYNLRLSDGENSYCESGGQTLTDPIAVNDDFDEAARGVKPDIGADEFAGIAAYVEPPASLTATDISSQQNQLAFTGNEAGNDVVLVHNATGTFTAPEGAAVVGEALAGGTVLYVGTVSPQLHEGLTTGVPVYYKAFCYNGTNYSPSGLQANATPAVDPPTGFTASCEGAGQIGLDWTKNSAGHDVLVAADSAYMNGDPVNGTAYAVDDPIPSGGTVIYKGPASTFDHTLLDAWEQYYYKAWSVDAYNYYSTAVTDNEITDANPIVAFPYLQDFDDPWDHNPEVPQNWRMEDLNGFGKWTSTAFHYSGTTGARVYGTGVCDDYLISPPVELPDTLVQMSWWDAVGSASDTYSYKVLLSTTGLEPESFTVELGDYNCSNTAWTQHIIDLSAYQNQTVYLAFYQYFSQTQYNSFAIDDVLIETKIPTEAGLVFPDNGLLTLNNPLLKWEAPLTSEAVSYKVYLDETADPSTLVYDGAETSFQTSGLANNTTYNWKVVPYNTDGEAMNVPIWAFTIVTATQLAESFEDDFFPPFGWSMDFGWNYSTSSAYHGSQSTRRQTTDTPVKLITPLLAIETGDRLEFFEGTASSTKQRIQLYYSADKTNWTKLGDTLLVTVAGWGFRSIDLSPLAGNNYYLAFGAFYNAEGSSAYVYLDHVTGPEIVPIPPNAAQSPYPGDTHTYLTPGCTLGWEPDNTGGAPTGYRVYLDTNPAPSTLVYDGSNPAYTVDPLQNNTTYYWQVIPYNAAGDAAACPVWSFTTAPEGFVQIGWGDTEGQSLPIDPYYGYNYSQSIYLQSEINLADQQLTRIFYYWNGGETGEEFKDWVVYLGHTTKTSFESTTDWIPVGSLTQVFAGVVTLTDAAGWVEIVLDTPFDYNNTDNLVVAVDENTAGYGSGDGEFVCSNTETYRSIYAQNDEINPDPANPPSADDYPDFIPNIRFGLESTAAVPDNYDFATTTLTNGQTECYNALNTITVAGGGTAVVFQSGSSATLIAGYSIQFLPGFHAQSGSYMSAYITTTGSFCDALPEVMMPEEYTSPETTKSKELKEEDTDETILGAKPTIVMYPNPTSGEVNFRFSNMEGPVSITVFSSTGTRIYEVKEVRESTEILNLSHLRKGICFVTVEGRDFRKTSKLVIR
nr:choice-of-anchor J domain-containing protein [Prolixibacteraceae bacterium]